MKYKEFLKCSKDNDFHRPYLIAEAGVNHEGSMETAKKLIDLAAEGGADAIKFQSYKAELIASKNSPSYWDLSSEPTTSQFELFKKYDKFWKNEYEQLKVECDKAGIEFLSTPFDLESCTFLNELQEVFKISSSDITNFELLEAVRALGKPVILSTGASRSDEILRTVEFLSKAVNVSILHCVLSYPTKNSDANLGMIQGLKEMFPSNVIGYSDHTLPGNMDNLVYAYLLGARILEKHFTHNKALKGNDHYHAMDLNDLKKFNVQVEVLLNLVGKKNKSVLTCEADSRLYARRSVVLARPIRSGETLMRDHLICKRPGTGIAPEYIEGLIGLKVITDMPADHILEWRDVEKKVV